MLNQHVCSSLRTIALACASLLALNAPAGPGAWDPAFVPAVSGGPVYATAIQPDGRILLGGAFTSVNGSVVLDFPGLMDAEFDVETLNGDIRSELPCPIAQGSRRLRGTMGHGGPVVSVRTSNGSVWLFRTV